MGAIAFAVVVVVAAVIALRWLHHRQRARAERMIAAKFPGERED